MAKFEVWETSESKLYQNEEVCVYETDDWAKAMQFAKEKGQKLTKVEKISGTATKYGCANKVVCRSYSTPSGNTFLYFNNSLFV